MLTKLLILDWDGTLRHVDTNSTPWVVDNKPMPGVENRINEYKAAGYIPVVVSNQGGVAFGIKTQDDTRKEFIEFTEKFENGNPFLCAALCPAHPRGNVEPFNRESLFRKPNYGMVIEIILTLMNAGIEADIPNSIVVGDMESDRQLARNIGANFMWAEDWRKNGIDSNRNAL